MSVDWVRERRIGIGALSGMLRCIMAPLVVTLGIALPSILATVPPVLHCVVASSLESSGDLCPPLPHLLDQPLDLLAFLRGDWLMVQTGLEVLVVSFSALLW